MLAFFTSVGRALVAHLPASVVRLLLMIVVVGAFALHVWASGRITELEHEVVELKIADTLLKSQDEALRLQHGYLIRSVDDLTTEVRGYRSDVQEQNKLLRARVMMRDSRDTRDTRTLRD